MKTIYFHRVKILCSRSVGNYCTIPNFFVPEFCRMPNPRIDCFQTEMFKTGIKQNLDVGYYMQQSEASIRIEVRVYVLEVSIKTSRWTGKPFSKDQLVPFRTHFVIRMCDFIIKQQISECIGCIVGKLGIIVHLH